jgi:predicted Zn-dependent protease
MLGPSKIREICNFLLKASQPAQAEVWIEFFDEALTRFANNAIHQNVNENNASVTLRVSLDGRVGAASTNRLESEALNMLAKDALAHACCTPVDPNDPGLPDAQPIQPVSAFDGATAACSPDRRAAPVKEVCAKAAEAALNAAGAFSTTAIEMAYANSNGAFAYHPFTCAEFQTTIMGADASGRGQGAAWRLDDLNVADLGAEAIATARAGRAPRPLEPGEYPVILLPYAVLDLVSNLSSHGVNGLSVLEGRSWMIGRQGLHAASPLISLWDDGRDERSIPLPFDGEGQPRQHVDVIRQGQVLDAVYDRAIAKKAGVQSTGHALPPAERSYGAMACNLFMAPGSANYQDLLNSVPRGLLITRFWYTRLVKARDCVMTGMTRDGVFWVENGEVKDSVRNLRFTQSYIQALADVVAVGDRDPLLKAQYGQIFARVPALAINRFRFTS